MHEERKYKSAIELLLRNCCRDGKNKKWTEKSNNYDNDNDKLFDVYKTRTAYNENNRMKWENWLYYKKKTNSSLKVQPSGIASLIISRSHSHSRSSTTSIVRWSNGGEET